MTLAAGGAAQVKTVQRAFAQAFALQAHLQAAIQFLLAQRKPFLAEIQAAQAAGDTQQAALARRDTRIVRPETDQAIRQSKHDLTLPMIAKTTKGAKQVTPSDLRRLGLDRSMVRAADVALVHMEKQLKNLQPDAASGSSSSQGTGSGTGSSQGTGTDSGHSGTTNP